jgi:general secretion pathway protein J
MKAPRGFTLMEVMVAVAITALMGAIIAMSFQTGFHAKEVVETDSERYRMLRTAMDRMVHELDAAYLSERYDARKYRDQNDRPTNFIGEAESLTFSTLAHQRLYADAKESDEMVVQYSVKSGVDPSAHDRRDLVRRENPIVQGPIDRGGTEDVLFEGANKIQFQYWDSEKKDWVDEWDTRRLEREAQLPSRVKITLFAKDENGKEQRYTTQARIMMNTAIPRY